MYLCIDNQPLDRLQYARVRVISSNSCRKHFPPPLICSTGYYFPQQCPFNNDAGAALVTRGPPPEELYIQIGLFAAMTDAGCKYGDPVAYLDISLFLAWIRSFK